MAKKALITGITGQDGSYLAEFLLEKGYEVHGVIRRSSVSTTERIDHLIAAGSIRLHDGDLSDSSSIIRIVNEVQPDEIYNLAAQSHVQVSFDAAEYTGDVDALGVLRILEAVHMLGLDKKTRIYQASTSELYGKVEECPQSETTPFHPYSPYAVAKQYGYWMIKEYREAYGMFACNGILFNHESERRGETFVTTVVLQTRRERVDLPQGSAEDQLRLTQSINDQFIRVVEQLNVRPRFMITKGGITSSDCLTRGLRVRREWVSGQIEPGIGVIRCDRASRFPELPVVIFPGNVGEDDTLAKIVAKLNTAQA